MAKKTKPDAKVKRKPNRSENAKRHRRNTGEEPAGISVAGHPRAFLHVRRAKGWGGLIGFVLAALLSYNAGVPPVMVGERAVVAGIAGYLLAWACSVTVWRHLVLAELRTAAEAMQARHQAAMEAADSDGRFID